MHVLPCPHITTQAMADQDGTQGVVEALSSSGAVSTWFMAHVYELLQAVPLAPAASGAGRGRKGGLAVLERPLPLSGGDQVCVWLCGCVCMWLFVAENMAWLDLWHICFV